MEFVLLGVNHRTAPLAVRERLALGLEPSRDLMCRGAREGAWSESCVLNTCNRTEIYAASEDAEVTEAFLRTETTRACGADVLAPGSHRYHLTGIAVAHHLFRVAAGLDSMVVGEVQILGQVRAALAQARDAGAVGGPLDLLFNAALHAGKRARAETAISRGAVSVASAAVALAARRLGGLASRHVLVIGAGETGRLLALHAAGKRPARLVIANRTLARAEALAAECGGAAASLVELEAAIAAADVVFAATRASQPIVARDVVLRAFDSRPARPLLLIDVAVPRSIDPAAADTGALLVTIDAVEAAAWGGLEKRQLEARRVEAIVEEECAHFAARLGGLGATPVLRELRERFERLRVAEVKKSLSHFDERERPEVERLTRALVNKLLHLPTTRLREADPATLSGRLRLRAARELFAIEEQNGDGS